MKPERALKQFMLCLASLLVARTLHAAPTPDIVLTGWVDGLQNHTYITVPFEVPPGINRLTVVFRYTGKQEHTALDLGIEDPHRFRGWGGGDKDRFTIGVADATPSYLPGEIVAGQWKLLIGVPNIRRQSRSAYKADIYFERRGAMVSSRGFTTMPLRKGARWYRGDLHMHSAHSDGTCASQSGEQVPCPLFVSAESAVRRGLDFIAVTDHNTISQFDEMRELQPYFDRLLLIPGREITTFQGHINVLGPTSFIDFRVGSRDVPDMNAMLNRGKSLGAILSINHPNDPGGESCMGCRWQPDPSADIDLFSAIEAVNGSEEEGSSSGIGFWEEQLQKGKRLTAIGGSDNHHADWPPDRIGSIGSPTTVVYASELSVDAILDGIKAGHVFVDLTGSHERLLELKASDGGASAMMGDVMNAPAGSAVLISVHVMGGAGSVIFLSLDGKPDSGLSPRRVTRNDDVQALTWRSDGRRHWLRADLKSSKGKLLLLGNPIYLNYANAETLSKTAIPVFHR